jgi:NAD(P)-dependent dehydrogenase (short-subunit alcohol dehydrogenase family)
MPGGPDLRFDGRTVVITGAAGGIGAALSRAFSANGAQLVLVDISTDGLQELAAELAGPVMCAAVDVTDPAAAFALPGQVIDHFGAADVLVNNAGGNERVLPHEVTLAHWDRLMTLNLKSAFIMSKAFGLQMIRQRHGNIINISSTCGVSGMGRGNFVYSVAKSGLNHLTKELALEWGASGIRVNGIVPSQVEVPGSMHDWRDWVDAEGAVMAEKIVNSTPLGRPITPDDIAGPVLFLASDAAAMVTGTLLPVDGGSLTLNRISTVGQAISLD